MAGEGMSADDEVLTLVARRAAGSMRDAQTLLDQLLGFVPDGHVTAAAVHALLGTAGDDRVADLAAAILAGDVRTAVEQVTIAADRGLQLGELLDQLVDYWRGLMLVLVAGPEAPDLPGTPALQEAIRQHAAGRNLDTILAGLDILTSAKSRSRGSPHVQVLTEVAVIRLARMDELLSVAQLAQCLDEGTVPEVPRGEVRSQSDGAVRDGFTGPLPTQNGAGAPKKNARNEPDGPVNGQETPGIPGSAEDNFVAVWSRILQELGPMLRAHLQALELPAIIGPNTLAIRVPSDYSAAYDALASESGQAAIRQALRRQTREEWSLRIERTGEPSGAGRPAVVVPTHGTDRKLDLLRLPIFRRAQDVLGAQLVRIEDGFNPTPARPEAWTEPEATAETPEPSED
jgi:DNA polymerase-3 subunit gamma/tau